MELCAQEIDMLSRRGAAIVSSVLFDVIVLDDLL